MPPFHGTKSYRLSCPGKLFIAGEYSCIQGGPALVATLGPRFELSVRPSGAPRPGPFAQNSPAGVFISRNRDVFQEFDLRWHDPSTVPLGVGSSSAQFLLSVAAATELQNRPLPAAEAVLASYWETVGSSLGLRPSGVDVVAQWVGGPAVIQNEPVAVEKLTPWDEKNATWLVAFTGTKTKTHEHLSDLRARGFPDAYSEALDQLAAATQRIIAAWKRGDAPALGAGLNAFQTAVDRGGLSPDAFRQKLQAIRGWRGVLGAKGSGAQGGGDCVLILAEPALVAEIAGKVVELGWTMFRPGWDYRGLVIER